MKWRMVYTDTELCSGVAPVCDRPDEHTEWHARSDGDPGQDGAQVYDCCRGPHIECWTPRFAGAIHTILNGADAEICS